MTIEDEDRARRAQEVLDNGIIDEALKEIERDTLEHLLRLGADDDAERRRAADMILAARAIRVKLEGIIQAHKARAKERIRTI